MSIKLSRKKLAIMLLIAGSVFSSYGHASPLMIDDFSYAQSVFDRGNSVGAASNTVNGLTGTGLSNASRTFTALATAGPWENKESISSGYDQETGKYLLNIANSLGSSGVAGIVWKFDTIDFTKHGNAILLDVESIDFHVNVEMVVNGIASSGVKAFVGVGDFLVNFDDFTNSYAFQNVQSLSLTFTGPKAWDGKFNIMTADTAPVPVPPTIALMGTALLGMIGVGRGKQVKQS